MNQRQPRIEDAAHLAFVRTLPCLVCGRPGPNDPAHIRAAAPTYGKRRTGMGEKPDDKRERRPRTPKPILRKPKGQRKAVPAGRKLQSRNDLRRSISMEE